MSNGGSIPYEVMFQNNWTEVVDVALFVQTPSGAPSGIVTLAWLVDIAAPTTTISFEWYLGDGTAYDWNFYWMPTVAPAAGTVFNMPMTSGNLTTANEVTFSQQSGTYGFLPPTPGAVQGTLSINQDSTVTASTAAVAFGLGGSPAFALPAVASTVYSLTMTPPTQLSQPAVSYGIITAPLGGLQLGQGLTTTQTTISTEQGITFPPNVYAATVTLNADGSWSNTAQTPSVQTGPPPLPISPRNLRTSSKGRP